MNLRRFFTKDEAPLNLRAAFYTVEKIGEKREFTPEGFLVCYDVPIARTGSMTYVAGEVPVDAGADGLITVVRDAADVFTEAHIKSYLGKPVIDEHPTNDSGAVSPENWVQLSRGVVLNPRRGEGVLSDCLLADLLICEQAAIDQVLAGKIEVSCGYDADYEPIAPGKGRQRNLIGNHVALVDAGRCGPRCAIGDRKTFSSGERMSACTQDKKPTWLDRIRAALKTKDEKLIEAALGEAEKETSGSASDSSVHVHLHSGAATAGATTDELPDDPDKKYRDGVEARFGQIEKSVTDGFAEMKKHLDDISKKGPAGEEVTDDAEAVKEIEGKLKEEAPAGTNDAAIKAGTKDSVLLASSFQEAVAGAEILVPGMAMPAFDKGAQAKVTLDSICSLRRKSLELAYATTDGKAAIDSLTGGATPDFGKMPCGQERVLFRAAVGMRKAANNFVVHDHRTVKTVEVKDKPKPIRTAAELNARMREVYPKA